MTPERPQTAVDLALEAAGMLRGHQAPLGGVRRLEVTEVEEEVRQKINNIEQEQELRTYHWLGTCKLNSGGGFSKWRERKSSSNAMPKSSRDPINL